MQKVPDIKTCPPGPKAKKIILLDTKYLATSTKLSPIVVKRANGAVVEDVDGNLYLDFTSGVCVLNTGHCHPHVVNAVQEQVSLLMHFAGTDFYYEVQARLAQHLAELTPGRFAKKVFFTNSGAESNEAAIKLARWHTQRKQFVAFIGAFHGRTIATLALSASKPVHRNRYFPLMPGVVHIPYAYCYRCAYNLTYPECDLWCAKILDEVYFNTFLPHEEVAGLFIEPIQGEGGYVVPPKKFVQEIARIVKKYRILMIDDEVQTGFGRTGRFFAIEHYDVVPDIVAIAKGMGSGMPIGAIVFKSELDWGVKGAHSNTYGGNPVACAAALATIEVIEREKLLDNATKVGIYLNKRLYELKEKHELIGDVRGLGLMQTTELVENRKTKHHATAKRDKILTLAYKRGLLLLPCGISGIRFVPPLIITTEQIDTAIEIVNKCLVCV